MKKTFSDITILIDIDDTLTELLPAWCKWLNNLSGSSPMIPLSALQRRLSELSK